MQNFTTRMQQLLALCAILLSTQVLSAQVTNPRAAQISFETTNGTADVTGIMAVFGSARSLYCGGEVSGESMLMINDGSDTPTTACEAVQDDIAGRIAFIDQGDCQFSQQVLSAQTAGASAVIVCAEDAPVLMGTGDFGGEVTIPAYMINAGDCVTLRALGNGTLTIVAAPPAFDPRDNVVWGANGEGSFTDNLGDWEAVDYAACATEEEGFTLWQWNNTNAGNGAYASDLATVNSPTACSGTALFNSDFYDNAGTAGNFGNGDCAAPQQGALISPSIDLSSVSAEAGLAVKFYQGLRQFQSNFYIGWSIDGGMTWDSTEINTDLEVNSTLVSRSERVRLPKELNGQSDVRLKFSMFGNYYYWIVDDVQIIERESFNLAVDPFFAIPPSSITPASQIVPFGFLADVRNRGAAGQENVVLNMTILNNESGEVVYTNSLDYGTIPADSTVENQAFEGLFTPPAENAVYSGLYSITSDNEEFDPQDNAQSFLFAVSDTTFAKELGGGFTSVAPDFEETPTWSYGNYFYVPNGDGYEVTSITFGIGNPEEAAGLFAVATLLTWEDANADGIPQGDERQLVDFVEYEIVGDEEANAPINISFNNPPALASDTEYILLMNYGGPIRATATDDLALNYVATGLLADSLATGRGDYATFFGDTDDFVNVALEASGNFTAFIRMHINTVGVNTENVLAEENKVDLFPNPTSEELTVRFDLIETLDKVTLRVTDATGRVISHRPFKNVQHNSFSFDVSNLASGVYYMDIITEAGHRTERFVVTR